MLSNYERFQFGYGSVSWLVFAELLPTEVRSVAFPLGLSIMWLANFVIGFTFTGIKNSPLGDHGAIWTFAAISLAGLVFISICIPETKDKSVLQVWSLMINFSRVFLGRIHSCGRLNHDQALDFCTMLKTITS